ncbi:HTH_Tnp_Tc3_2 domain-containing protein [Trichonephila clavipes]|nr:HTH_Tnp_Tc3_2 domain-containing protein [Trichonephila clavipes]
MMDLMSCLRTVRPASRNAHLSSVNFYVAHQPIWVGTPELDPSPMFGKIRVFATRSEFLKPPGGQEHNEKHAYANKEIWNQSEYSAAVGKAYIRQRVSGTVARLATAAAMVRPFHEYIVDIENWVKHETHDIAAAGKNHARTGQRRLTRIVKLDRRATLPQIATDFNAGSSTSVIVGTIQRNIIDMGFRNRRLTRLSLLTARHKALRLSWACQHRHWTVDD